MKRFLPFLLSIVLLAGCTPQQAAAEPAQVQFFAMDTLMSIRVYNEGGEDAVQAARQEVERLDKLLSRTDADSTISALNSHAGDGTMVSLEPEVTQLLSFAKSVSELLPGDFDITIAPVMDAWGFTTEERHVPSEEALSAAMAPAADPPVSAAPPPGRRSVPGSVAWVPPVAGLMMAGDVVLTLAGLKTV